MALAALLGGRLLSGRPGFLDGVSDGFTRYLPLDWFEAGIQAFGPLAKGLLFAGICAAVVLFGALLSVPLSRIRTRRGAVADAMVLALVVLVAAELAVLPLFGGGFGGSGLGYDALALHLPTVVAAAAYGAGLIGLRESWRVDGLGGAAAQLEPGEGVTLGRAPGGPLTRPIERRTFLGRALVFAGLASIVGSIAALAMEFGRVGRPLNGGGPGGGTAGGATPNPGSTPAPGATPRAPGPADFGSTPALTPVDRFYVVQKNFISPTVDGGSWKLTVDGLVQTSMSWTLDQLRQLPSQTAYRTLQCISYSIVDGSSTIGNQKWTGVRVSELLDRAVVRPEATWILWESADGYTESIPIDVARDQDTWIAYAMGDAPLGVDHGFPARVLIAGRFGMKQPKWVTRMQLADHDQQGYWEQRGWDENAFSREMSRIDSPQSGDAVKAAVPFAVTGIANAGDRGIARVELSADDGATWVDATLEDATKPPLGPLTWIRWRADVTLPTTAVGSTRRLVVRATAGDGAVQDGTARPSLPTGSTGWHAVRVAVVA